MQVVALRNRAREAQIALLEWTCEQCGEVSTRGAMAAHLRDCTGVVCSASAAGCVWAGAAAQQPGHEASCLFVVCQRMLEHTVAPLQMRCDGLQAENARLRERVARVAGRVTALECGAGGERRQRQRAGPACGGGLVLGGIGFDEDEGSDTSDRKSTV